MSARDYGSLTIEQRDSHVAAAASEEQEEREFIHAVAATQNSNNRALTLTETDEGGAPIEREESRGLLLPASRPSTSSEVAVMTPDQLLNSYSAFNPYILMIFLLMAFVWALTAMPMMASAFLLGNICMNTTGENCTMTPGTIAEEFDLRGSRAKFSDLTTMSFLLGNALGSNPVSRFADLRGRRAALILSLSMFGAFGLLAILSQNVYVFMFLRLCQGLFFPGCGIVNWVTRESGFV